MHRRMVRDISEFMKFKAMFKYCLKQEKQTVYIPLASLMILTMFESLDGGFRFVSRLFSSAFNLFF